MHGKAGKPYGSAYINSCRTCLNRPGKTWLKGSPTKVKKTFVPPVHSTGVRVEGKDAGEQAGNLLKLLSEAKITF